jgi:hypothetical protein
MTRCLARCVGGDEGQVDLGLDRRAELDLGLLGRLLEPLQRHAVSPEVDALLLAEFLGDPVDDALVEVVAAEMGVAVGGLHLERRPGPISRMEMSNVPPPRS